MSNAALDPTATCVVVENVFTPTGLDTVERYGDSLQQQEALLGSGSAAAKIRITRTAALTFKPEIKWLYDACWPSSVP